MGVTHKLMKSIFDLKNIFFAPLVVSSILVQTSCKQNNPLGDYKGTPFANKIYKEGAQKIPGRLQCEYYDLGGENVAYHDIDSVNSGSGGLNKANGSYLHEFRSKEAVDISYTKFQDPPIDNSPYNFVDPIANDLYIGWTEAGEWVKYTIDVKEKGRYNLSLMYTANKNAKIGLAINDKMVSPSIEIPSTYVAKDTIGFRQWHHWNYLKNMTKIDLETGLQTFTVHTVATGNMNYNYIDFQLSDKE